MDIKKLKTYCEKSLGFPIVDVDIHEEWIETFIEFAKEDLEETGITLSEEAEKVFIKRYVVAAAKEGVARAKSMYPVKGCTIDWEVLLTEGKQEKKKLFEDLEKERKT